MGGLSDRRLDLSLAKDAGYSRKLFGCRALSRLPNRLPLKLPKEPFAVHRLTRHFVRAIMSLQMEDDMNAHLSVENDPEKVRTTYEWVVEEVDKDGILDCWYWDDRNAAVGCAARIRQEGSEFDFGLCYSKGSDCEGEIDRQYAYCPRNTTDNLPAEFDGGRAVPKRFLP